MCQASARSFRYCIANPHNPVCKVGSTPSHPVYKKTKAERSDRPNPPYQEVIFTFAFTSRSELKEISTAECSSKLSVGFLSDKMQTGGSRICHTSFTI